MADIREAILQMAALLQKLAQPTPPPSSPEQTLEALATHISEFSFDPENGITFDKWYIRYADIFESDAKNLDDAAKVRLLLRKLDTPSHTQYVNYSVVTSIFNKHYQCLQLVKSDAEDIISYGGKVNRACEDFDFKNVKIDQFKCLVFICGLKSHCYADIRTRLLARIENETPEAPFNLQTLIDEYQWLVKLKADTTMIERQSRSRPSVHAVHEKKEQHFHQQQPSSKTENKLPRTPCWQCGQIHYEGSCGCLSKSKPTSRGKKPPESPKVKSNVVYIVNHINRRPNKRKFVPANINGVVTNLQLDTASDITVISKQTWKTLGKPTLKEPSIQAVNASGKPLQLIGEFQCKTSVNNKTCHARCYVTVSPNLNLFGIDWIEKFGLWSVPIDPVCKQVKAKPVHKLTQPRKRRKNDDPNNKKYGAVHKRFQQGDLVYAKVHQANFWKWEPATVIEKVGKVNYNVFLQKRHRLIRSHINQFKT
ncbi:uncharacterized protein K02A2.6-like [Uranotaenia lowii]|uniref:uncharacterized protein K02A2.6-like n=1 Tax=Uranotaenia lowii TaxID=190385 RepID=UPI00247B27CF|nr:uncharacterized protein K02A2.6-like [Uranotaenia lowii]